MSKRVNPYTALQQTARDWARKVLHPRRVQMYKFAGAERGTDRYTVSDVYERVAAADQLGYDVRFYVKAQDPNLYAEYVRRNPDCPWEFSP